MVTFIFSLRPQHRD